jgi:tetratricopeptide (TPR) repeat protein
VFLTIAATAGISASLARGGDDAQAPVCAAAGSLGGVWDAERRAGVASALANSSLPYAAAMWSAIAPKMDAYAAELAALGGRACVARAASGGSNSPILSAQERCLARRRFGLEATARVIARGDPGAVAGALTAVEGLEPLALCEDPAALMAAAAAGDDEADPRRLAAIREAERLLAQSKAEADAESFVTARGLAEEALAAAELLNDRRLIAAALLRLGFAQEGAGDFGGAESTLRRGYEAAEVAREDRLAVDAATAMLRLEGRERRDAAATRIWEVVAAAKLARSGDDVEQQVRLMLEAGIAVIEAGDLLGGAPKIRAAAALAEASAAASERLKISALNLLASGVLKREGEMAAAQALTEKALARHVALLGPDHPYGGMLIYNLGVILLERGELEAARAAFERSLAIREGAYGADHPEVAQSLNGLAAALGDLGRGEEAIPWALRSLAIEEQSRGAAHPELCYALNNLASLMIAAGRFDEAEAHLRRARVILEEHGLATNSLNGMIEESFASLEQRRGRDEEALVHRLRALAAAEASLGAENPAVGAMRAKVGEALLALGRAEEAAPHLAGALVVLAGAPGAGPMLAQTRLLEARRLWRRRVDRDRALAVAREAAAALAATDGDEAAKAEVLAMLRSWLADPGP